MPQVLNDALVKPEIEVARRRLDIFLLVDCSSSMEGLPMGSANQGVRESLTELKDEASQHPQVDCRLRCIKFANTADWHIGPEAVDVEQVSWTDLVANGCTSTGKAVQKLADAVRDGEMPRRGLPPVMVLVSDGANTDGTSYDNAIDALDKEPWGSRAIRLSIGIGSHYDRAQLEKFTNHPEVGVLEAKNAVDLVNYIKYATVTATITASRNSTVPGKMTNNVALPMPPLPVNNVSSLQVF